MVDNEHITAKEVAGIVDPGFTNEQYLKDHLMGVFSCRQCIAAIRGDVNQLLKVKSDRFIFTCTVDPEYINNVACH